MAEEITKKLLVTPLPLRVSWYHRALWSLCEGAGKVWLRLLTRYRGALRTEAFPPFIEERQQIERLFQPLIDQAKQCDSASDAMFLHAATLAMIVKYGDRRTREESYRTKLWLIYHTIGVFGAMFLTFNALLATIPAIMDGTAVPWRLVALWFLSTLAAALYAERRDHRARQPAPGPK